MSYYTIDQLREMREKAKKSKPPKQLYVTLGGTTARVLALTNCAMPYGSPGFRCVNGDGWYALTAAEWTFSIR